MTQTSKAQSSPILVEQNVLKMFCWPLSVLWCWGFVYLDCVIGLRNASVLLSWYFMSVISVVGSNAQRSQDVAQPYNVDGRLWQADEGTQKQPVYQHVRQPTREDQLSGPRWLFSPTSQSNPWGTIGAPTNWEVKPDEDFLQRLLRLSCRHRWIILMMMFLCLLTASTWLVLHAD